MASNNRPTLAITGGLDKQATKKNIQGQLDKLGSELKLTIGVDKNASKDAKNVTEEKKKQLNVERLISEAKERTARAEQKQFDLARSKTSKLLKQEIQDRVTIEKQTLKQANAEKVITNQLEKQREKLALFQAEMERKSTKLTSGKFGSTVDMDALSSLQSRASGLSIGSADDIKSVQSEINKINSQFKDISLNAQQARTGFVRFADESAHSLKKFSEYFFIGSLVMGTIGAIQSGVQAVFELDKALTELKKVVTITDSELKNFIADSYNLADALGATNLQLIESVTIFSKMGYALDQATQLGQLAVKLQTVGDGMGSMEDTANSLVAVLKGFGVDENSAVAETTKRVDQLNAVSNAMAVSTGDITAGLQRASAGLAISGNSFEQTTALLTAGTEVLRDSEMVARGLITTSQRIYDQGADALKQYGIETTNANGSIRSTFEILTDLHNILPTLTEDQQRWILTTISGKDQFKTIAAIMQNWNAVAKTMQVQMNANGSATEELNRKLDSLEGRVNKMTNAFSKFWTSAIDNNLVKAGITGITELVNAFTALNTASQGLLLPITAISIAMAKLFNRNIITMLYELLSGMGALTTAGYGVSGAFEIATMSLRTFQITLGIVGAALVGISVIFNQYQKAVQNAKEEADKFKTAQQELNAVLSAGDESTKSTKEEIEALVARYDELSKKVESLRGDVLGSGGKQISSEYKNASAELKKVTDRFQELGLTVKDAETKIKLANQALENTRRQSNVVTEAVDHARTRIYDLVDGYGLLDTAQKQLEEQGYVEKDVIDGITEKYGDFIDVTDLSAKAILSYTNTKKKAIVAQINNEIKLTDETIKNVEIRIQALQLEMKAYQELFLQQQASGFEPTLSKDYNPTKSLLKTLDSDMNALKVKRNSLSNALLEIENVTKDKTKDKSSSIPAEESYAVVEKDRYLELNQAVKELNITLEQNKALQENTSDLSKLNQLREEEIDLYKQKQKALEKLNVERFKERNGLISTISAKGGIFEGKGDEASFANYQSMRNKLIDKMNAERLAKDKTNFNKTKAQLEELDKLFERFSKVQYEDIPQARLEWAKLQTSINGVSKAMEDDLVEASEKAAKANEKILEDTKDLYKQIADALEKRDEEETRLRKKKIEERIKDTEKEIDALEKAYNDATNKLEKDELNEKIALLNKERAMRAIEGSLDANARIYEIDKELVELNKELSERERKNKYESDRKVLEDKKRSQETEIEKEEEALAQRKRNQEYYAQAKVMIENNAQQEIINLLKTYDDAFALDGRTKGQKWLDEFTAKILQAQALLASLGGATSINAGNVSTTFGGESKGSSTPSSSSNSGGNRVITKSNQQKYLENLSSSGTSGQKAWADAQLKAGKYHDGMEQGLVGGLPIPKDYEQLALLAKGEMVLNQPQLSNLSNAINSMIPKNLGQSMGSTIVNLTQNINAKIDSAMDIKTLSKGLAVDMQRELSRRGIRLG